MAPVTASAGLNCTDSVLFENDALDSWSLITSLHSM